MELALRNARCGSSEKHMLDNFTQVPGGYEFVDDDKKIVHVHTPIRHARMNMLRLDPAKLEAFIASIMIKRGARAADGGRASTPPLSGNH